MQEIYYLRLNSGDCTAEAWLNGVPISRVEANNCLLDGRPVHEYLLPGKNRVTLLVHPGTNPSYPSKAGEPFPAPPKAFATLDLLVGPKGTVPDDPQVKNLGGVSWKPQTSTIIQPPVVLETDIQLPARLPSWSWLDASKVELSEDLNSIVFAKLNEIVEGLRNGETSSYTALASTRFDEVAKAYDLSSNTTRANFQASWDKARQKPGFEMMKPSRQNLALRVCAFGRMIDCVDIEFEPVVRSAKLENGTTPLRIPIRFSFFGRELRIVR